MRSRRGAVVATLLLFVFAAYAIAGRASEVSYGGDRAPAFSFGYSDLKRVAPVGDEVVRLEGRSGGRLDRLLIVRPLSLPGRADPLVTALPFLARGFEKRADQRLSGYQRAVEGRTRLEIVKGRAAYMLGFTAESLAPTNRGARPAAGPWLGKTLLIPGPGDAPRSGVALELLERVGHGKVAAALGRARAGFLANWPNRFWVQQRTAVDAPTPLERPLRTFRFR